MIKKLLVGIAMVMLSTVSASASSHSTVTPISLPETAGKTTIQSAPPTTFLANVSKAGEASSILPIEIKKEKGTS
jgi:hypothetical protein